MYLLGYDIGSSSVKASLVDADSGLCAASAFYPKQEAPILSLRPTFSEQGQVSREAAAELGIPEGIPVSYRAGDQPNNALSLGVLKPGEIASMAGTSGVFYGVSGTVAYDPQSRVNSFAHVNYTPEDPRIGILLCINGTGILNSWMHRNVSPELGYTEMNKLAATAPVGSRGLCILPFGNGAERMLQNADPGCSFHGLNFNIHGRAELLRAAMCLIAAIFVWKLVPETKGKTLEDMTTLWRSQEK